MPTSGYRTIVAVGDFMPGGRALGVYGRLGYPSAFGDPGLARLIRSADVSFCNLECPITGSRTPHPGKAFTFRAPPGAIQALRQAGFDLVSLANNHIMDYGAEGLMDTLRHCARQRIAAAGAGPDLEAARRPAVVTRRGVTYGLLAYSMTYPEEFWAADASPGAARGVWGAVRDDIERLRPKVDVLIVSFHWGQELTDRPKPYQVDFARLAVDSGADAVIGHHPHVLQPIEIYRMRPVFYSLGNFFFGSCGRAASSSVAAEIVFDSGAPVKVVLHPIATDSSRTAFMPETAGFGHAKKIVGLIRSISAPFGTRIEEGRSLGTIRIRGAGPALTAGDAR
jgi:poly-gamma-glutamate synthesis protein (capsule biosynthesis protein)